MSAELPLMRLSLVRYWCSECREPFHAPDLTGDRGLLALRSTGLGTLRYVDPYSDPIFAEVEAFVARHVRSGLPDAETGRLVQHLFGFTVDADADGSPFVVGAMPPCHGCGHVVRYEVLDPPQAVDVAIEPVTHDAWTRLPQLERVSLLVEAARADDHVTFSDAD